MEHANLRLQVGTVGGGAIGYEVLKRLQVCTSVMPLLVWAWRQSERRQVVTATLQ